MTVSLTIKFSTTITEGNIYRLTIEVTDSSNISKNIFLMTSDGICKGVSSPYELYTFPENPVVGNLFYRSSIVSYTVRDSAEVIKIKNEIKESVQGLVNKWKEIGNVVGIEEWTTS